MISGAVLQICCEEICCEYVEQYISECSQAGTKYDCSSQVRTQGAWRCACQRDARRPVVRVRQVPCLHDVRARAAISRAISQEMLRVTSPNCPDRAREFTPSVRAMPAASARSTADTANCGCRRDAPARPV